MTISLTDPFMFLCFRLGLGRRLCALCFPGRETPVRGSVSTARGLRTGVRARWRARSCALWPKHAVERSGRCDYEEPPARVRLLGLHRLWLVCRGGFCGGHIRPLGVLQEAQSVNMQKPNQSVQPAGGGRFAQPVLEHQRRLPPVTDARR
jgi:hypothetical protein